MSVILVAAFTGCLFSFCLSSPWFLLWQVIPNGNLDFCSIMLYYYFLKFWILKISFLIWLFLTLLQQGKGETHLVIVRGRQNSSFPTWPPRITKREASSLCSGMVGICLPIRTLLIPAWMGTVGAPSHCSPLMPCGWRGGVTSSLLVNGPDFLLASSGNTSAGSGEQRIAEGWGWCPGSSLVSTDTGWTLDEVRRAAHYLSVGIKVLAPYLTFSDTPPAIREDWVGRLSQSSLLQMKSSSWLY